MSLQVEKLEHNMARLTIEASAEDLEKAINQAYQKNRGQIAIPGFRKGKAPRKLIEKMYGKNVFYEEASRTLVNEAYTREIEEHKELNIVSRPQVKVEKVVEGEPFVFTAEVALKPSVEIGKYKGIKVTKVDTSVTEEEVEERVRREQEQNSRMITVERPIRDGDIATIDFEGFVDGEAFDGGKGTDHDLTIGSHSFIDTFEEQLIGKSKDEETEVHVTFPEDYHEKSLAGKEAVFQVTIKEVKEKQLPELDDDFAQDAGFDSMEDFRKDIQEKIQKRKEADAKAKKEDEAVKALIADSNMDIPDAMVETRAEQMVENYAVSLQNQGLSFDQYMKYTGMTPERLVDQMRDRARSSIESRLVLEAVAEAEHLEATEEEVEERIKEMAEGYRMEAEKLKEIMGEEEKESIRTDLAIQKAADYLLEHAKEVAEKKTKKAEEE